MLVRFSKAPPAAKADILTCVRPDGTITATELPRQGTLPHDAVHFVVENVFGWHDAQFGRVARGATLESVHRKLHGGEQAAGVKLTQALQSEALVECLEAEQWGGASDPATFAIKLIAACRRRSVEPPDVTDDELKRVRVALREFGAAWRPLQPGASLERTF